MADFRCAALFFTVIWWDHRVGSDRRTVATVPLPRDVVRLPMAVSVSTFRCAALFLTVILWDHRVGGGRRTVATVQFPGVVVRWRSQ